MAERPHIGIIGNGNVGSALRRGLDRVGYEVDAVGRSPRVKEVAEHAEIVLLAVPFAERENAIREIGPALDGKVLVDVTNAVDDRGNLVVDPRRESGAERVQRFARGAQVVKAFNTVFAQNMERGTVGGEPLTTFLAGDNERAKEHVSEIARAIGFEPVDAGALKNARWLETLGILNIALGYGEGLGTNIGFRLVGARAGAGAGAGGARAGAREEERRVEERRPGGPPRR
ncbi:MAG: NADPH-dependent F420 reductase [Methanobacteriota archaeon]